MKNPLVYQQTYFKPVRSMREYDLVVEAYLDQSVKRYKTNTVFADLSEYVDRIPLLNVYGQWIYNSLMQNPEEEIK